MRFVFLSVLFMTLLVGTQVRSEDMPPSPMPAFTLTLKDHVFTPPQLTVPANEKIKLTVRNLDPTPAEFESDDFQAEKVVPANEEVSLTIAPLKPGTYGFFDDFHEDETKGTLVAQ
jgi:hypothetical protein